MYSSQKKYGDFIRPMLAKETDQAFDDKDWLFEIKWDGYRAICELNNGKVKLYSRNGINFEKAYQPLVEEFKKIKQRAVLDGEIVVLDKQGRSQFQQLQHFEENKDLPLCYIAFDLLMLNGKDTCQLPLLQRKQLLKQLLKKNKLVRYSDHVKEKGIAFFKAAGKNGLEGIMAKKADSTYQNGIRTANWLKIKQHKSEEVLVVGYTEPTGSRKHFGSLVLAVRGEQGLKYAGHTGTGFNEQLLAEIFSKLEKIKTGKSPFAERVKTNRPVTWVKPQYVAEVKFTGWTTDGKMRHPVFMRMRPDKSIKEVIMKSTKQKKAGEAVAENTDADHAAQMVLGKNKVTISNRDKIYWPGKKITKGMMIDYYQAVAPYLLPYLKDRPESLKRNPNGIIDKGFYQKDAGADAPSFVKTIELHSASADKEIDYIVCNNTATLAYLNNLGCIELNPWHSTIRSLDKPDYLVIDIDPSAKNSFDQVIETTLAFKQVLDKAGAESFCKTSGATGMHIYLPMAKQYDYEKVRGFAEIICRMVNEQLPGITSMERNLKKRGNKHIYLDHLQNSRGQTIASVYSLRPEKDASVSTPLLWKEVKKGIHPADYNIQTIPERLNKIKDIFHGILGKGTDIRECLNRLNP